MECRYKYRVRNPLGYIKDPVPSCIGYLPEDSRLTHTFVKRQIDKSRREWNSLGSSVLQRLV